MIGHRCWASFQVSNIPRFSRCKAAAAAKPSPSPSCQDFTTTWRQATTNGRCLCDCTRSALANGSRARVQSVTDCAGKTTGCVTAAAGCRRLVQLKLAADFRRGAQQKAIRRAAWLGREPAVCDEQWVGRTDGTFEELVVEKAAISRWSEWDVRGNSRAGGFVMSDGLTVYARQLGEVIVPASGHQAATGFRPLAPWPP